MQVKSLCEKSKDSTQRGDSEGTSIQDMEGEPILMGADVIGLYPNLDPVSVAKITSEAVMNSKVSFGGFNYMYLMVYLLLVLGQSELEKAGLGDCIPRRKIKSESTSLSRKVNKDINSWDFSQITLNEYKKRKMIMIHLMVLLLTSMT